MNYQSGLWTKIYDQYNSGRYEYELDFYKKECTVQNGKCLEIAVGTGMIFLKLLEKKLDIYGFDISEQMLNSLYNKANSLGFPEHDVTERISCQNMVSFSYPHKFDLIFIPARSFLHLTSQEDQINCLAQIYNHLNAGGRFLINFFQPNLESIVKKSKPDKGWQHHSRYQFEDDTPPIELLYRQTNDIPNQIQHIEWKFVENRREIITKMEVRWVYKEEFQLLLRLAGFKKWNVFGDFNKTELTNDSNEMIWEVYA